MEGEPRLVLTGQLGDVMKESAQIALSYLRSHSSLLGIDARQLAEGAVHLHVPAGAVPKDGPSAGKILKLKPRRHRTPHQRKPAPIPHSRPKPASRLHHRLQHLARLRIAP